MQTILCIFLLGKLSIYTSKPVRLERLLIHIVFDSGHSRQLCPSFRILIDQSPALSIRLMMVTQHARAHFSLRRYVLNRPFACIFTTVILPKDIFSPGFGCGAHSQTFIYRKYLTSRFESPQKGYQSMHHLTIKQERR